MVDQISLGLGAATLSLLCVWTISFIIAHLVRPTTWSPIKNAVSEYGVLPHKTAKFIWICWWTMGGISWLLCAGLGHTMYVVTNGNLSSLGIAGIVVLGIFGLARILTSIFPTDVKDNAPDDVKAHKAKTQPQTENDDSTQRRHSQEGILHIVFALISFISIVIASHLFTNEFKSQDYTSIHLGEKYLVLSGFSWAEVAAILLMVLGRRCFVDAFGVLERIFYATHVGWLYACTVLLIMSSFDIN